MLCIQSISTSVKSFTDLKIGGAVCFKNRHIRLMTQGIAPQHIVFSFFQKWRGGLNKAKRFEVYDSSWEKEFICFV